AIGLVDVVDLLRARGACVLLQRGLDRGRALIALRVLRDSGQQGSAALLDGCLRDVRRDTELLCDVVDRHHLEDVIKGHGVPSVGGRAPGSSPRVAVWMGTSAHPFAIRIGYSDPKHPGGCT